MPWTQKVCSEKLKASGITLGLVPKGTALALSESHGSVKVFVLICVLKAWLKGAAPVGDMLYEMALDLNVQNNWPLSALSLTQVVDVILAYTPRMTEAAIKHMSCIGLSLQGLRAASEVPRKIYHTGAGTSFGKLINSVFRHYVDVHDVHLTLHGSVSALYIVGLFTWLVPEDVCANFKNNIIGGSHDAKIKIEVQDLEHQSEEWTIQVWKESSAKEIISFPQTLLSSKRMADHVMSPGKYQDNIFEQNIDSQMTSSWSLAR